MPVNAGRIPAAFIASRPRRRWHVIMVNIEVNQYYETVLRACSISLIAYNIPQFTNFALDKNNIAALFNHSQVIGMKHTSQDLFSLERLRSAYPEKIFFNGLDEMYLPAMASGAQATIGTTVNIQPELFRGVRE